MHFCITDHYQTKQQCANPSYPLTKKMKFMYSKFLPAQEMCKQMSNLKSTNHENLYWPSMRTFWPHFF